MFFLMKILECNSVIQWPLACYCLSLRVMMPDFLHRDGGASSRNSSRRTGSSYFISLHTGGTSRQRKLAQSTEYRLLVTAAASICLWMYMSLGMVDEMEIHEKLAVAAGAIKGQY